MPEGIYENLPPPKTELIKKVGDLIKGLNPRERRKRYIRERIKEVPNPKVRVLPETRVRIVPDEEERKPNTLPDLKQNITASEQFIKSLRNPSRYSQDPNDLRFMKSSLGCRVEKPSETGWFDLSSVLTMARERYNLPLAIYVGADHHARLLIRGYFNTPGGKKITVYNPFNSGFEEIDVKFDVNGHTIGVLKNTSDKPLQEEEFNLMKVLESPELAKYRDLLTNIKAFGFQKDTMNCIPYCLFVSAMLHGLEPGITELKRQGIKQFEQDFGVKIITREEILPKKPMVRVIE